MSCNLYVFFFNVCKRCTQIISCSTPTSPLPKKGVVMSMKMRSVSAILWTVVSGINLMVTDFFGWLGEEKLFDKKIFMSCFSVYWNFLLFFYQVATFCVKVSICCIHTTMWQVLFVLAVTCLLRNWSLLQSLFVGVGLRLDSIAAA